MTKKEFQEACKAKKVLKGVVKMKQKASLPGEEASLVVDVEGNRVIVLASELEPLQHSPKLEMYIGQEINIVITYAPEGKDGVMYGSNKEAEAIIRKPIMDALENGKILEGRIISLLQFGAYVVIGNVTGLLKNLDFSKDGTRVKDVKKVGDLVKVKLFKTSTNGTLIFQVAKYTTTPSVVSVKDFEAGQVVSGVVTSVKVDKAFVCIANGIDALSPNPDYLDIEEGSKVSFKIKKVTKTQDNQVKVRGRILRVIVE